jgi:hypothetical protein
MSRSLRWYSGALIGLIGAAMSLVVLLATGLLTGRGASLITDAGARMLPQGVAAASGLSPAAAYLIVHLAFYLIAGLAAVILARLADRSPAIMTGLVFAMIIVEFGFLVFSTETAAQHLIDGFTWGAFLVAHGVGDVAFLLLLLWAHPSLLRALREGYET